MTLFNKFLTYAKNIYNHKDGYTLTNAYKYFGEDYQNFLLFYRNWLSAKTTNNNKRRITYIQMQNIKNILDILEKIKEETVKTEALRDKALQNLSNAYSKKAYQFGQTSDIYSELYNSISLNDKNSVGGSELFYNEYLKESFNKEFVDFVDKYYDYDKENQVFVMNLDGYVKERNDIINNIMENQNKSYKQFIKQSQQVIDETARLKDIKNYAVEQLNEVLQEITSLNESIFFE